MLLISEKLLATDSRFDQFARINTKYPGDFLQGSERHGIPAVFKLAHVAAAKARCERERFLAEPFGSPDILNVLSYTLL